LSAVLQASAVAPRVPIHIPDGGMPQKTSSFSATRLSIYDGQGHVVQGRSGERTKLFLHDAARGGKTPSALPMHGQFLHT
jgi:hypothetical protein